MIFIIDKLKFNKMEFNKNVQLLKWKQEYNHQKINYNKINKYIYIINIIIFLFNYINYYKD